MNVTTDELLLIDWVLSGQGAHVDGKLLDDLMSWASMRETVWRCLIRATLDSAKETAIELTETEAEQLLAVLPTTMKWGSGEDVGFSLKVKLAEYLWGGDERTLALMRAAFKPKEEVPDASSSSDSPKPNQDHASHETYADD